jgi:SAM-dependent methyltransferase
MAGLSDPAIRIVLQPDTRSKSQQMSMAQSPPATLSPRKQEIRRSFDASASERAEWRGRASFFHSEDLRYLKFVIPEGSRVLELGCCTGELLAELKPSFGVGVDLSSSAIDEARRAYPDYSFYAGDIEAPGFIESLPGPFDFIIIVDTLGSLDDCQQMFENLHCLCTRQTRLIVGYFSHLWYPPIKFAEAIRLKMPQPPQNVLSSVDVRSLAALADFDALKSERRLLSPLRLFGLGRLINRFVAPIPVFNSLCLRHYTVCRSLRRLGETPRTATVVIPARNERGNIEPAIKRIPLFADALEIIFVEGHSGDDTWGEIERVVAANPQINIKALRQLGEGKADAVYTGFDAASGDVLMILDADLTMPPEQLPKFWEAIRLQKGEFINGSRLIYPMENEAMRFLNLVANKIFSLLFTWLLGQRFTDTLCGTKVIRRSDYARLKDTRSYFGDFDPFGDFDLIFGVSKLGLKIIEVPIRYASRTYGATQISRFRHGLLLLRMVWFAFLRIKAP